MAAIDLPLAGEVYLGDRPGVERTALCIYGFTANGIDVATIAQATYALINVPADTLVLRVRNRILTAFTNSVTIDIGDGADPNGWLATAKVAPTSAPSGATAGVHTLSQLPTAEAYAGGKLYEAADTIDAVVGGATPLAGLAHVLITYIPNYTALTLGRAA